MCALLRKMFAMFNTPILYIVFNRLDTVKQSFNVIKAQKPAKLFVAADGARKNRAGEEALCKEVREWILSNIDWTCELKTNFREENAGCGKNVSSAITWFFSEVSEGIVLEDDCLANETFFAYAQNLLNKYRDNKRIMHIAGDNPLEVSLHGKDSYYFANIMHCWGWASWADRWQSYQFDIKDIDFTLKNNAYFKNPYAKLYWRNKFLDIQNHKIDTWDYQWLYAILKNGGLAINPCKNLITNIGLTSTGTHFYGTQNESVHCRKNYCIDKIVHPKKIAINKKFVSLIDDKNFGINRSYFFHASDFVKRRVKALLKKFF